QPELPRPRTGAEEVDGSLTPASAGEPEGSGLPGSGIPVCCRHQMSRHGASLPERIIGFDRPAEHEGGIAVDERPRGDPEVTVRTGADLGDPDRERGPGPLPRGREFGVVVVEQPR